MFLRFECVVPCVRLGRQFGSAVSLGWQKSVLSAYFCISTRSVGQIVMIMLCVGCFVSSVDELRIISKLSFFNTWVGSLGRQFRLAGKNWYLCVSVSICIGYRNTLHSSLVCHWRKLIS